MNCLRRIISSRRIAKPIAMYCLYKLQWSRTHARARTLHPTPCCEIIRSDLAFTQISVWNTTISTTPTPSDAIIDARPCVCAHGPVTAQKRSALDTHSAVCSARRVEPLRETVRRYRCQELHHRDPKAKGTARRPPYRERGEKRGSGEGRTMKAYCCATGECAWSWPASLRYVRCCGNACAHPCARGGVLHDTREQSRTTVNPMLFLLH